MDNLDERIEKAYEEEDRDELLAIADEVYHSNENVAVSKITLSNLVTIAYKYLELHEQEESVGPLRIIVKEDNNVH